MSKVTFRDSEDRQWSCRITIADARRLKSAGSDICNPEGFQVLFGNTLSQVELIAELMRPQWEAVGMKYEQFADFLIAVDGRFAEVQECFANALTDFFQRLGEPHLARLAAKAREAAIKAVAAQLARVEGPRINQMIDAMLAADEKRFESAVDVELAKLSGEISPSAKESSDPR